MRKILPISPPDKDEYDPFYAHYIELAKIYGDGLRALEDSKNKLIAVVDNIGEAKAEYRYAIDKWTPKELIQHIIDSEVVFLYRALRIARKDKTALPGFNQDLYVQNSYANDYTLFEIMEQFKLLRLLTILTFTHFHPKTFTYKGVANKNEVTVRALAFIIAGHTLHHAEVLEERYL